MDCLANIKFLDALDQPIEGLVHQLWVGSLLISHHVTPSSGESVWFKRSIGTKIDIRVRSSISGEYHSKVKIQLVGEKTTFIVRSPKVLLKGVNLSAKDVATGTYVRSTYIVAEGDYLSRIADDNHTTTEELIRINNLSSDIDIHPGQILKIPVKKQETPAASENKSKPQETKPIHQEKTKIIVVQQTDTLPLIAKLTANSVAEIKKLSGLSSDRLSPNQKLRVYDRAVTPTTTVPKAEKKEEKKPVILPTIKQQASKNKEKTPVAKVVTPVPVNAKGLLPQACGGEKHYKRTLARIAELHPVYQPYVIKLINTGYQKLGICWTITDGYRSPSAQDALPSANTNARALQSYHQYGLAVDVWSVRDGEIVSYNKSLGDKRYQITENDHNALGPIGESLGLVWGGRWKSPVDRPHYQLIPNGKTWRVLKPQLLKIGLTNYKKLTF